jgi:archaellum component FlaF (FlaF/FlaG flagellin family)
MSLAETLKAAIDEGTPSPTPLSSVLLRSISVERVLQLLVMLLLLASALLPGELPIGDCVAMVVMLAAAIIVDLVLCVKLKSFNFAADHINVAALLRNAEALSDEVRNVHLNKSISTIAVQREENGVISFERNMAAVVPLNSVVKFHPSEKNNLPVGVTELTNVKSGSRWTYAYVSQNLAVDCLKRLLQRARPPSFDPLTRNIHNTLNRISWLLIVIASVILFAFVRNPLSDLPVALRSIAVLIMPLLPSMISFSITLSVAAINASISSHSKLSPSADDVGSKRGSVHYERMADSTEPSASSPWSFSSFLSKFASYVRQILHVNVLPAVSDDNKHPVSISIVSVIHWLFSAWSRMFHECNYMHMMGRITVLCVLDKEGILAEPQPEAKYVMYARTASVDDSAPISRSRTISRTSSTSAADVVDASFITVPINQNDGGKWEFRFENDPDKVEEKRSLEIFRQIAVCSQLTTDKLDIDEDAPKPANACVKGLLDLCTLINDQYDDKSVPKPDKVPIWKKLVDLISPGTRLAAARGRAVSRAHLTFVHQESTSPSCSVVGLGTRRWT